MALELSPRYQEVLETGDFRSLLSPSPWPHFVLDDLIRPQDFHSTQDRLVKQAIHFRTAEDHPAKIQLRYMQDLELAEFFFSAPVRALFEGIAQCSLTPNEKIAIQFRRMTPDSPVFPPHVDLVGTPSLVSLYYVAPGWTPANGGELLLLQNEDSDWNSPATKSLAPVENRLVLFMSDDRYWHCVRRVQDWTRLMVLTEWLKGA